MGIHVLKETLRDFGLSADQIAGICEYYHDLDEFINSEDYEIAAISGLSLEDVRRLKEFAASRMLEDRGNITRDFLKRWSRVLSEEDLERAYEEYDRLSKINPESPVVWQIKGELLEKMNRHREAREAFKRAKELYEKQNEIPPAYLEEKLHGVSYRNRSAGNGIGLVNGLGFMNGRGRSQVNGFSNGFKNGIINGSGLVNGAGSPGSPRRDRTPPILRFIVSVLLILVIIYAPLMGVFFFSHGPAFAVDGNFEEWSSEIPYYNLRASPEDVNVTVVKFHSTEKGLYFFVETQEKLFVNSSGVYIFIDSDMNSETGYLVDGIGADFMAEVYGWNGSVVGRTLYFFNSTDNSDFSKFISMGSVAAMAKYNKLEGLIPRHFERFRSVVVTTDYAGGFDEATVPEYGEFSVPVLTRSYEDVIEYNTTTPVLEIKIAGFGRNVEVYNMSFTFNGTATPFDMDRLALYLDNGDGKFGPGDSLITDAWRTSDGSVVEFPDLNLRVKNATVFLTVRCHWTYLDQRTILATLKSIGMNYPYEIIDLSDGGSYIHSIPDEVHVDGSFLDWLGAKVDSPGDVLDPSGNPTGGDYNIDILQYSSFTGNSLYFYVSVNGRMMGGTECPVERMFTLPDSDRDTVPDRFDLYPHDFNNDGIPDEESTIEVNGESMPDVDADGVADYPYGEDMWLNTTIPDDFPEPYAGKEVHVYIGPVEAHPVYGYDIMRIYVNSDGNRTTGFSLPQYPLGADYMVEIYGKEGEVKNASLYVYENHGWRYVSEARYFIGYHSIEIDSGIRTSKADSVIIISDWDSDRDISDSPLINVATRSDYVHKQLHLHYNATAQELQMDTFPGSTGYYINLEAGTYTYWVMRPPFAEDFEISAYPVASLYLVPHPLIIGWWKLIPGLNVSLYVYNSSQDSARLVGYDYNPDLENEGWYNFTIKNTTSVKKGEMLVLVASSTGFSVGQSKTSVDIYFNSTDRDSLVDLPTSTYINVDEIRTYNATSEARVFDGGELITVRAKVSDPFGYRDISGASITVRYPNGTVLISNGTMTRESSSGNYSIFSYSFTVPDTPGEFSVEITALESNGVTASSTYSFFVRAFLQPVIYPDTTKTSDPGTTVIFNLTLENIGNVGDLFYILPSESSEHFPFRLYISGSLAAYDSDGDGMWNWINSSWEHNGSVGVYLNRGDSVDVVVSKQVPQGTWGESDLLILTAVSSTNSTYNDSVRIRTNVPVLSVKKVLYLNTTSSLSLKHGISDESVSLRAGSSHEWDYPEIYYDVNLTGYILVNMYIDANPSAYSGVALRVYLYADSNLIGRDEILGVDNPKWYTFTIVPQFNTIPAGSEIRLVLDVEGYGTSATVYYDSDAHPSNVTIPTSDHIEIRSLLLYNSTGVSSTFAAGEDVRVVARVTSPFGPEDISDAYLNITDPLGNAQLQAQRMDVLSESGGEKIYEYTYTIPQGGLSGYWGVRVDVHDDPVLRVNSSTRFFIPWNVSVDPDYNVSTNVSDSVREFVFNHTITNTGLGANIFEIKVTSSNGFHLKLIIDGTVAAEDYDGDGNWDYVNPSYDFDGDGNPDTGLLLPGESREVQISVAVPAGFKGEENTSIEAYSFLSQSIRDDATDRITAVPEIQDLVIIAIIPMVAILIKRRGRFTPS